MADLNYCGSALAVVAASPATFDSSGYAALTWTAAVGGLVDISTVGDTSKDIPIPYLSGRVSHVNGGVDGGERTITFAWETSDPGQVILRNNQNNNVAVSCRITDADGRISYFTGVVANIQDTARNDASYKGQTAVIRVRSVTVRA